MQSWPFTPLDQEFFHITSSGNRDLEMSEPGVQIMGARSKRTPHTPHQMSEETDENGQPSWHHHFHPPPSNMANDRAPRLPPIHTRNSYDFRRPAPLAQEDEVIDLTAEPETSPPRTPNRHPDHRGSGNGRQPRFERDIMADIVDLEEGSDISAEASSSSSPEVQFVGATVRQQPPNISALPSYSLFNPSLLYGAPNPFAESRLPSFLGYRHARHARHARNARNAGVPLGYMDVDRFWVGDSQPEPLLDLNVSLDYDTPSFPLNTPNPQTNLSRRDIYKAPSPAPQGFTRTIGEDDMAICPNCYEELGVGEGKKQQIWVAKPCGHVYCGECAENRSVSKAKKATQKTKPFSKCQVVDCGKSVSPPTAMFHLYL